MKWRFFANHRIDCCRPEKCPLLNSFLTRLFSIVLLSYLSLLENSHGKLCRVDAEAARNPKWRKTENPKVDRGRRAIDRWSTEEKSSRKAHTIGATEPRLPGADAIQVLTFPRQIGLLFPVF